MVGRRVEAPRFHVQARRLLAEAQEVWPASLEEFVGKGDDVVQRGLCVGVSVEHMELVSSSPFQTSVRIPF